MSYGELDKKKGSQRLNFGILDKIKYSTEFQNLVIEAICSKILY